MELNVTLKRKHIPYPPVSAVADAIDAGKA
jgi:hypothetical protein